MNQPAAPPPREQSIHARILQDLRGRIVSGEWPPGHRIASESDIAAEYGCSRMTANKAMSELAKDGLIERRRRAGSVVRRPRSQAAVLEIHDIRVEVEALGLAYGYQRLARGVRPATKADASEHGFAETTPLLALSCLHRAGGSPFCLEERLISLVAVPEAQAEPFDSTAPGAWLIAKVPWSAAEHTIRAVSADGATAKELAIGAGSACLVVERRTWSGGLPVTAVRLTYSGETHSLVARFTPQG